MRHHHHISLREQLQVAGASNSATMQSGVPQAKLTTPGAPKSIFGRLGIRKPSILSLSSPQPSQGSAARTFSLDDLLRPIPRRKLDKPSCCTSPITHLPLYFFSLPLSPLPILKFAFQQFTLLNLSFFQTSNCTLNTFVKI